MSPYIASTDQHRHSSWSLWVFTSFGQNSRGWGWLISKSTNQWISTQSVFLNIGPVFFCWFASCQIHIYKWKYTNTQSISLNMGPVFFCRSASCQINWQLDILAILGHWGGRKQDELEEKILIIHGDISQSMWSSVFSIGDVAVKSFTTIFISIQITPNFSSHEIPKQCHVKTICITGI